MSAPATDGWYLAECYRPQLAGPPLDEAMTQLDLAAASEATGARLLFTVCAPVDEVLYSLFWAPSLESVVQVCARAGFPADRVSVGVDARINANAEASLLAAFMPRRVREAPDCRTAKK